METSKTLTITGVICLAIAGFLVGWGISSDNSTKEIKRLTDQHVKEIQDSVAVKEAEITKLQVRIDSLDILLKASSKQIEDLTKSVVDDNSKTQIKRNEAQKLTPNEKRTWLLDRYSTKP